MNWEAIKRYWIDHLNAHPMAAHHGLPEVKGADYRELCIAHEGLRAALKEWEEKKCPSCEACIADAESAREDCMDLTRELRAAESSLSEARAALENAGSDLTYIIDLLASALGVGGPCHAADVKNAKDGAIRLRITLRESLRPRGEAKPRIIDGRMAPPGDPEQALLDKLGLCGCGSKKCPKCYQQLPKSGEGREAR